MGALRIFFGTHRRLAWLLVAMALAMKVVVPAGYMIGVQDKVLTVEICSEASGQHLTKQITIPHDGKGTDTPAQQGKADGTCAFLSLSMAAWGGADFALLALALAFILLLGFVPVAPALRERPAYLRPPLRGPPAFA